MKLLVTGGLGFIGSHFIRRILRTHPNYDIINLDKITYAGNTENLKDVQSNEHYTFIKGDICDRKLVDSLMSGTDAIVNFAAETHVDRSIADASSFVHTDVLGVHNLLECAKNHHIKKFLHISTDEVYGSIKNGSFTENSPLEPNSPYAASKAGGDMLVRAYHHTYGLPTLITRSSNNYGPNQHPEKFIPLFTTNLIEGKKVPLYGTGTNVRDWLYVGDNCEAIDIVLHHGTVGEVYNIGGECEKQNKDVMNLILEELGKGEEYIEHVADRLGHDFRYSIDTSKIRKLGWHPRTPFTQGLKQTIEWYREHPLWWKKLK